MVESDAGVLVWKLFGGLAGAMTLIGGWLKWGVADANKRITEEARLGEARSAKNAETAHESARILHQRADDIERRKADKIDVDRDISKLEERIDKRFDKIDQRMDGFSTEMKEHRTEANAKIDRVIEMLSKNGHP